MINDASRKTHEEREQEGRHKKTSLEKYSPLTLLQGFEMLACDRMLETERKLHIYVMTVTLCLYCSPDVGIYSNGAFPRAPSVWCGLPYHISSLTLWESAGNCIGGFRGPPSVGCGLPYHISPLTLWESAGNCIGGFRGSPRSGVAFPTTSRL